MDYTPGRNLLRNSGEFTSLSRWSANQHVSLSLENGEIKAVTNQSTSTPGIRYSYSEKIKLEPGTYTLSVVAKIVSEKNSRIPFPCYTYGTGANIPATAQQTEELEDGYCKYSRTFEISAATTSMWLGILFSSPNVGDIIFLRSIKLEYGSDVTPWRPAPEDAVDIISGGGVEFMILARNSITVSRAIDIDSYTRYYLLQSSTANPPAKPTSATPGGNWSTTEPTYTAGSTNSLYFVDKTTFTDGTFSYSNVSLSTEYEAAKSAYNLAHTANTNAGAAQTTANTALAQSTEYIAGTQAAATNSWTGVTQDATLEVGKTIAYKLPYAGNSSNASLTLTLATGQTTAAVPVYLNTTRVTTHFGAEAVINMTYDGAAWRASSIPNTNTNTYDRRLHNDNILAATAITKNYLIVGTDAGYKNLAASVTFNLSYPILWASAAITAAASAKTTYEAYPAVPFSTSGTIESGAAAKMLYLKGTVSGNTFTVAATNYLTTVIPTSADGNYYIPLGVMTSATAGYFATSNRLFAYLNGSFQAVDTAAAGIAQTAQSDLAAHKNYFWHDSSGAHISDVAGSTTGKNVLIDSSSVKIKDGANVIGEFSGTQVHLSKELYIQHRVGDQFDYKMESVFSPMRSEDDETKKLFFGITDPESLIPGEPPNIRASVSYPDYKTSILLNADNIKVNGREIIAWKIAYKAVRISESPNRYFSFTRVGNIVLATAYLQGPYSEGVSSWSSIIPEGYRPWIGIYTQSTRALNVNQNSMTSNFEAIMRYETNGNINMICKSSMDSSWKVEFSHAYVSMAAWPEEDNYN